MNANEANWSTLEPAQMIDLILENFHEKHRRDLEELIPLAQKVESVHADHPEVPKGLSSFLNLLSRELDMHMQKEEQILFPMIKSGQGAMAEGPISVMMQEHVGHQENLAKLRELSKNYKLPEDPCGSWQALYKGVSTLEQEITNHINTENEFLFPKALAGSKSDEPSGCCGSCT